jgi:hypothetical protein
MLEALADSLEYVRTVPFATPSDTLHIPWTIGIAVGALVANIGVAIFAGMTARAARMATADSARIYDESKAANIHVLPDGYNVNNRVVDAPVLVVVNDGPTIAWDIEVWIDDQKMKDIQILERDDRDLVVTEKHFHLSTMSAGTVAVHIKWKHRSKHAPTTLDVEIELIHSCGRYIPKHNRLTLH